MASISSPGVGSGGLDVKSIIAQLVALEKKPLDALKLQQQAVSTKISAWGKIKSLVAALGDAAGQLASVTGWNAVSATSSDAKSVSATAAGGTQPTSFVVEVQGLARAQATASAPLLPVGTAVGAGVLRLETGRWSGTAFATAGGAAAVEIAVSASDTLADIAGKINGAGAGVSATVLSDATGERLLLRGSNTGAAAGFRLSVLEGADRDPGSRANTDAAGLSRLVAGSTQTQAAVDARATVNGIAVTSASNNFASTVSGVSFKAEQLTSAPLEISVSRDTAAIKSRIDDFIKAYNAVNQQLQEATKYDAQTHSAGLLQGDATAIALQNALRRTLGAASSGAGAFRSLADAGLAQQLGGDLALDAGRFGRALEHPEDLKNLFRNPGTGAAQGLALRLKTLTTGLLAGDGLFQSRDETLQLRLKRNSQDQARANDKVAAFEKQITRRYNALDKQLSSLDALSAYVTQQVTVWNKNTP